MRRGTELSFSEAVVRLVPSETPPPSHRVAVRTLPYALPIAIGLVLLSWSVLELASVFTDAYWVITELVSPLIVLTLGTALMLFGGSGAISQALGATIEPSIEHQ